MTQQVLINGEWRAADASSTFQATNPTTGQTLEEIYPVSSKADCEAAIEAATEAFIELRSKSPA